MLKKIAVSEMESLRHHKENKADGSILIVFCTYITIYA